MTTGHEFTFTVNGGDIATKNAKAKLLASGVERVNVIKVSDEEQILKALYVHPEDDSDLSKMRAGLSAVRETFSKARNVVGGSMLFVTVEG